MPIYIKPTTVAVFCASSAGKNEIHEEKTYDLGSYLAMENHHIYYGGGQDGNMGALVDGATENNGLVTALIPEMYFNQDEKFHKNVTVQKCQSDLERLETFMACDFKIVASGGFGSMGEMGVAMARTVDSTYIQADVNPMIFFNVDGHWNPMKDQLNAIIQNGFGKKQAASLFRFTDKPSDVIDIIQAGPVNVKRLSHA